MSPEESQWLEWAKASPIPTHVGIIMDGNGRWAQRRGLHRREGHRAGVESIRRCLPALLRLGVKHCSLFVFSTENWRRPRDEVEFLMNLVVEWASQDKSEFVKHGVRIVPVGRWKELPAPVASSLSRAAKDTEGGCALQLLACVNYGGRQEIVDAAFQASREFHAMPMDDKRRLPINENNIGYLAPNESIQGASTVHKATRPNLNESFFISHDRGAAHPDVVAGLPLRGRNQWPDGHDGMRTAMMRYFTTLEAVGERMLPVLARALEMPANAFTPFFTDEAHVNLRFLHYPPQETDDEQFGQGPHTDNSFITILAREIGRAHV